MIRLELVIATGQSRKAKLWKNTKISWTALVERLEQTTRTPETQGEYFNLTKSKQDDIKDVGGFVGGEVIGGRRKSGSIKSRTILTLDADFASPDFCDDISLLFGFTYCIYSTHKHTPERPRLRLVIPLSRPCTPDEYEAVARMTAYEIGIDMFDDTTYQAHRLMYWPSTSQDAEYVFEHEDGTPLDVDAALDKYDDWRDVASWPVSSRQVKALSKNVSKQQDPTEKPGIIGAFCRTYDIHACIEMFLPEVYERCASGDRYTYIEGTSSAGLVVYEDGKFAYSNHATDPACGRLCNSFDLVRIHKFGDLDDDVKDGTPITKYPSYMRMEAFAGADIEVKKTRTREMHDSAREDFADELTDWELELELDKQGAPKATLKNILCILRNDKKLKGIAFNQHRDSIDAREPLPWEQVKPGWEKSDEAQLLSYLTENYSGLYAPEKTKNAVNTVAPERMYHPIRAYLDSIPAWDGVKRVDTLLIEYFGAEDNAYTRAVIRKTLTAAVARIYRPGIKFDSVLILNGPQGIGKSSFFAKLAGTWFSDSLTITDMRDKTSAEKLQGYWILELGELVGMRKMDAETVKSFITRTDDKYRASYGLSVSDHPRQCILVGSTNAEDGFLRDITGNRRFWPVRVSGKGNKKPWDLSDAEVRQIWAEAKALYQSNEPLYLDGAAEEIAEKEQKGALEADEREGMVRDYLDTLLPENWNMMELYERRNYLNEYDGLGIADGTVQREYVSNAEIWAECFGQPPTAMEPADSFKIAKIMKKFEDWEKADRKRIPIYGLQRLYKRCDN